jgi:cytochrome c oxidase subunit I
MIKLTTGLGGAVFLLMMVFGLIMRTAQSCLIDLKPAMLYQFLTAFSGVSPNVYSTIYNKIE